MFDRFQIIPVLTVSRAKGLSTRSLTDGIGSMACYDTDTHCQWDVDPHNTAMWYRIPTEKMELRKMTINVCSAEMSRRSIPFFKFFLQIFAVSIHVTAVYTHKKVLIYETMIFVIKYRIFAQKMKFFCARLCYNANNEFSSNNRELLGLLCTQSDDCTFSSMAKRRWRKMYIWEFIADENVLKERNVQK